MKDVYGNEVLSATLERAGNGQDVPQVADPETYGERYASVFKSIVDNGEDSAKQFTVLADHHQGIAEGYRKLADEVKANAIKAGHDYIKSLKRLDAATDAINASY